MTESRLSSRMTSQDGSNDIPAVFSVPSTRPSTSKLKPKPTITLTLCMDNSSQGNDYPCAVVAKPFSSDVSILRVVCIAFKDYLSPNQEIECGLARKTTDRCIRWVKLFDWESSVAADSEVGIFLKGSNMHDFPYLPPPSLHVAHAQAETHFPPLARKLIHVQYAYSTPENLDTPSPETMLTDSSTFKKICDEAFGSIKVFTPVTRNPTLTVKQLETRIDFQNIHLWSIIKDFPALFRFIEMQNEPIEICAIYSD